MLVCGILVFLVTFAPNAEPGFLDGFVQVMVSACGNCFCEVLADNVHVLLLQPEGWLVCEEWLPDAVVCVDPCCGAKCPLLVRVLHVGGHEPIVVELENFDDRDVCQVEMVSGHLAIECAVGKCCN